MITIKGDYITAKGGGAAKPNELSGMSVLLAEDNAVNQMVAISILTKLGVDVTVVDNGLKAIESLKNITYDLVLMDIEMPEMDGLTAASRIRADPKYNDLPILALTTNALPEDREMSLKSGMNDHLTKPIDPRKLHSALLQWRRKGRV